MKLFIRKPAAVPAASPEPKVEGTVPQGLALCNQVARTIMGWHVVAGDAKRHWRDASGEVVNCDAVHGPHAAQQLVAAPYLFEDHPDDDGQAICFRPTRFDEHWQMLERRIAALGIVIEQDRHKTRASNANGAIEVAPFFKTATAFCPKRTAVLYALVRLVAEGHVDVEDIGDVCRHRAEALNQQRLLRQQWRTL